MRVLKSMIRKLTPETIIKRTIKQYLGYQGWFNFPILQGIGSHRGICDIIAAKNGVTLYIEIKTPKGKLSTHQEIFKDSIERAGCVFVVVRCLEDIIAACDNVKEMVLQRTYSNLLSS